MQNELSHRPLERKRERDNIAALNYYCPKEERKTQVSDKMIFIWNQMMSGFLYNYPALNIQQS